MYSMKSKISFHDLKMSIPDKKGIDTHFYGDLMYIMVDKPYCDLFFAGNIKCHVEVSIKEMMNNLPKAGFIQCNRSAIANLCYMKRFNKNPRTLEMSDGTIIKLSSLNMYEFENILKSTPRISPPCRNCYICTEDECESRVVFCRRK